MANLPISQATYLKATECIISCFHIWPNITCCHNECIYNSLQHRFYLFCSLYI